MTDNDNTYIETLGRLLRTNKDKEVAKLINEHKLDKSEDFTQYMDRMITISGMKRIEIAERSGLSLDYLYKLLRKDKKTTERD